MKNNFSKNKSRPTIITVALIVINVCLAGYTGLQFFINGKNQELRKDKSTANTTLISAAPTFTAPATITPLPGPDPFLDENYIPDYPVKTGWQEKSIAKYNAEWPYRIKDFMMDQEFQLIGNEYTYTYPFTDYVAVPNFTGYYSEILNKYDWHPDVNLMSEGVQGAYIGYYKKLSNEYINVVIVSDHNGPYSNDPGKAPTLACPCTATWTFFIGKMYRIK